MPGGKQERWSLVYYRQYRALRVRINLDSGKPVPIARCSCLVLPAVIVGDAVFKGEYIDVVDLPLSVVPTSLSRPSPFAH